MKSKEKQKGETRTMKLRITYPVDFDSICLEVVKKSNQSILALIPLPVVH